MTAKSSTSVWVKFTRVGFHNWEKAAEVLPERAYLADRHRHLFHFTVEVPVTHDDRQIEFHHLRDQLCEWLPAEPIEFGGKSCEAIAHDVMLFLYEEYPWLPWAHVGVSEDGEAGADIFAAVNQ